MLRTDVIDLVNSRGMWALVGSGVSMGAGGPGWRSLVERCAESLGASADGEVLRHLARERFPSCLGRLERLKGRADLEGAVKSALAGLSQPGEGHRMLADWPFRGYITTNYDTLLERAVNEVDPGWGSVGNTGDEPRQLGGDPSRVIWHPHGSLALPPEKSRLVLTDADYRETYRPDSALVLHLRALLAQRRLVFAGFGFKDPDLLAILAAIAPSLNPSRPAFAFLAGTMSEGNRVGMLDELNVDVIAYDSRGGHQGFITTLNTYHSFILRRSLSFGQPERPRPDFDPETTGLALYNAIVLRDERGVAKDVLPTLIRARVLSSLRVGSRGRDALLEDIAERVGLLGSESLDEALSAARSVLDAVTRDGLVEGDELLNLSAKGAELVAEHSSVVQRMAGQFGASIRARIESAGLDDDGSRRVERAVVSFILECTRRRALGVAMALDAPREDFRQFHMVALLQSARDYLPQMRGDDEALALVNAILAVIGSPTDAERSYIGLALQAEFGLNLMGYSEDTLRARLRVAEGSLFVLDSTLLLQVLGRSSPGHQAATQLLSQLAMTRSPVTTTERLVEEVAEHARWAIDHVSSEGSLTVDSLSAATGVAGQRANVFLDGFVAEFADGLQRSLLDYLDSVCGSPAGHLATGETIAAALGRIGIPVVPFPRWTGFDESLWEEREKLAAQIAELRAQRMTFRHERQVMAEAEALLAVRGIRDGSLGWEGERLAGAYFVSNSRVIDHVAGTGDPITMSPPALHQWLTTLTPVSADELAGLFDGLIGELHERNLAVVDRSRLQRAFSPLITAGRERLTEELAMHRGLVAARFGESASRAFLEVEPLALPVVAKALDGQMISALAAELEARDRRIHQLSRSARLTESERVELGQLRELEKQRKRNAAAKQRASADKGRRRRTSKKRG